MTDFNKVFPVYDSDYEVVYEGFKSELIGLAVLLSSHKKSLYLSRISNYDGYKKIITEKQYKKNISKLIKEDAVIDIGQQSDVLTDAILTAHLAVCCELLDGAEIVYDDLKPENIEFTLEKLLGKYKKLAKGDAALSVLESKLHSIDAFRTVQILKALGLYTIETERVTQLSLGVGSGSKDLKSIHLEPVLKVLSGKTIKFGVNRRSVKDVILVDEDPQRKELFKELSKNKEYQTIAINDNAFNVLSKLPNILKERGLEKRNAVIALRIDHRMIPDVKEFFRLVANSIDSVANLIVTIGSGFDMDDFEGRTKVMRDMYAMLKNIGLRPVLIRLHGNGELGEQWRNHAFGLKSMTTYQILHCKLKKNILIKLAN